MLMRAKIELLPMSELHARFLQQTKEVLSASLLRSVLFKITLLITLSLQNSNWAGMKALSGQWKKHLYWPGIPLGDRAAMKECFFAIF